MIDLRWNIKIGRGSCAMCPWIGLRRRGYGLSISCAYRLLTCFNNTISHSFMRLTERNISAILQAFFNGVLRTDDVAHWIFDGELLYDCQLSFLHLRVDLKKHAFLGLFLMIYYSVSFHSLVCGMHRSGRARLLSHCELIIDLD